ncbi:hypothetical protein ACRYCC_31945 [Actinomadura scrupuli]|uniref:hypothetical protein n=1 Tax=Actinomadura scrupuli TaxID=559629 RepID=UPI003D97ECB5
MLPRVRPTLLTAAALAAVVTAAGCGTDAPASPAATPGRTSAAAPAPAVVTVNIVRGRVETRHRRVKVARGRTVRIVVTSDVAAEFHLHGYDRTLRLKPGAPGTLEFTAGLPGTFEAELHGSGIRLFELQVG